MDNAFTPRLGLPLLAAGQSQKEITHNEALLLLDIAAMATVERADLSTPPTGNGNGLAFGQAWLVADNATGLWTDREGQIAVWSEGGWRYLAPREGFAIWIRESAKCARFQSGAWFHPPIVANASGGTNVDSECRATLATVIDLLKNWGLARM